MDNSTVESLKKLGLTEYEAKAYAALVGLGEATAREVHEASGVPRTRIYDVLKDLADKGFVEFISGSPTFYRVIEPEMVLEKLRGDLLEAIDISEKELKKLDLEVRGSSPVWCVKGEWAIKNRIRDFLENRDEELMIFCQSPDFLKEYKSELKKHRLKVIVDVAEKFEGFGFDVLGLKPDFAKLFYGLDIEGNVFAPDCIMIKEGRESLVICGTGTNRMVVMIRIPLITILQKTFLGSLI